MLFISSHRAKTALIACISLTMAACSGLSERRIPERDFDYLKSELQSPLAVPEGIGQPERTRTFNITPLNPSNAYLSVLGRDVDVRAPAQVVELIEGGQVERTGEGKIFWFDLLAQDGLTESPSLIQAQVAEYLNDRNINIIARNDQGRTIEADWQQSSRRYKTGFIWGWSVHRLDMRYRYHILIGAGGRRVGLQAELLDIQQTSDKDELLLPLDSFERERQSTFELNRLIAYIHQQRVARQAEIAQLKEQEMLAAMTEAERRAYNNQQVELILDDQDGATTYLAQANMQRTLTRLRFAFDKMGFTISDYVETAGKLYLEYDRPKQAVLDQYGIGDMKVKQGELILTLGSDGRQTRITLADSKDQLLKPKVVRQLYPYFATMMKMDIAAEPPAPKP